jgi:hypothetical protein
MQRRMIWQARDAYRVQTFLLALFYLPQFFLALMVIHYAHAGQWVLALEMAAVILGLHGLRWLVRWSWAHGLVVVRRLFLLALLVGLSGCGDLAHSYQRAVWGIDCRAEKLHNGQCVAAR